MGKISPISSKYVIYTKIQTEGVVDRPDVIGAIFGQTEGLLGADLELRDLQRSGRIGRIDVTLEINSGKTEGSIIIPSSLDKTETVIIAAALETIQRIGPCNASVKVERVEDVRVSKRNFVISRAKDLLKQLTDAVLPDSQEITDEVAQSVRMMAAVEYGKERLPAGMDVEQAEEIILVEGRADVLNLLKHGIKNTIALNGTSVPLGIIELSKRKVITAFVDGDRGGDLIIRELMNVAEIDYVIKAPDGKEVEELTKKEIHKALRGKVAIEQVKLDIDGNGDRRYMKPRIPQRIQGSFQHKPVERRTQLTTKQKADFRKMLEDLIGTRGAYLLDQNLSVLGKVPIGELTTTIKNLNSVFAVIFDGEINSEFVDAAEGANVKYLIGMNSRINPKDTRIEVLTDVDLA